MSGNIRFMTFRIKNIIIFFSAIVLTLICLMPVRSMIAAVSEKCENGVKLPIIMYHSVLKDKSKSGKYIITPDMFEEDLKYLEDEGYTAVFMQDIIDYVYDGTPLPEKPIVLTFDDGHLNNETYIVPLLEKYNQRAVISIVGAYTERYSKEPDENPNYAYMSWKNVREVMDSGRVEIQNHSYDMHSLSKRRGTHKIKGESNAEYKAALVSDVGKMQELCRENLDYTPAVFTYPFGSISLESVDYLKEMGFLASLSCGEGMNYITNDKENLYLLKRCIRTDKRSVSDILS